MVLSNEEFNQSHADIIVAAITSRVPARPNTEDVPLTHSDAQVARLLKPSVIKTAKIATIDQRLIRKKLGQLPVPVRRKVHGKLRKLLMD